MATTLVCAEGSVRRRVWAFVGTFACICAHIGLLCGHMDAVKMCVWLSCLGASVHGLCVYICLFFRSLCGQLADNREYYGYRAGGLELRVSGAVAR